MSSSKGGSGTAPPKINAETARFCFLDFDTDGARQKLATAAAFVHATDTRYGFSSKQLRFLGGSEVARIPELLSMDHDWSDRGPILVRPPSSGGIRLVVELFWKVAPLACENFATLCYYSAPGTASSKSAAAPLGNGGKPLTFQNCRVHRIVPGFVVQTGDVLFGNGSGGEAVPSVGGNKGTFKDERAGLGLDHDKRGVLSMGNSGKNSNTSQFFLTLAAAPQCNGKHVVFGKLVSGWSVLADLEACGTSGGGGEPTVPIHITDCGLWNFGQDAGAGYWYDQPNEEAFSGVTPLFVVKPRVVLVAPSVAVAQKMQAQLQGHAVCCATLATDDADGEVANQVQEMWNAHAMDVVLVTPSSVSSLESFDCGASADFAKEQVVLVAKPVQVLQVLWSQSWLAQKRTDWALDGKTM